MDGPEWTTQDAEALRVAVGRFVRAGRLYDIIPSPQAAVLGYLDRDGPLTIVQLADRARVRHQSMRETIQTLQRSQALTTAPSHEDGRKVICSITPHGRTWLTRGREARTAWILAAVDRQLTSGQRAAAQQIAAILEGLAADGETEHPSTVDSGARQRRSPS